MIPLIEDRRAEVVRLCKLHKVMRLEVFGSAASGNFDSCRSDIDFLVEFLPLPDGEHANTYFSLLEDLQDLFGRSVDLVMHRAIKNPYFLESIASRRMVLYAA